jgi:hypothetical protein
MNEKYSYHIKKPSAGQHFYFYEQQPKRARARRSSTTPPRAAAVSEFESPLLVFASVETQGTPRSLPTSPTPTLSGPLVRHDRLWFLLFIVYSIGEL